MLSTNRFHNSCWVGLLFLFSFALAGAAANSGSRGFGLAAVVRTIAYHQITTLPGPIWAGGLQSPIISTNGNRAVFATPPGASPDVSNHIFVVNTDGGGMREVDAYQRLCFCGAYLDISATGGRVISSDSVQIRVVNADGSGKRTLVALDSNDINSIALSDDGTKVFFRVGRDSTVRGSNPFIPFQRGIWVINADGTGLRQIVGPAQMAALLGIPVGNVSAFQSNGSAVLDSSTDGGRIVFAMLIEPQSGGLGQGIFGVNLDGSGLHALIQREAFVSEVGISRNGAKVGFFISRLSDGLGEVGAMDFDGTGRVFLTDDAVDPDHRIGSGDRVQLTTDGSKLLLGSAGVLHNTDGTGKILLGSRTGFFSGDPLFASEHGLNQATMNGAGNKFLYLTPTGNDPIAFNTRFQLAIADLNPASIGSAPSVTNGTVEPPFVVRRLTAATQSARVTTAQTLIRVGNSVLINGVRARGMSENVLLDNGTAGDVTPNDKIFTNNGLFANSDAALGPHTVRIKAEVRTGAGLRHATAVDVEPFEVLGTPPTPTILRLHPKQARRGSTLVNMALEGTNLFNNSTVRFLLNGNADSKITVSNLTVVNAGKLVFTAAIAADAALGDRVVQVSNAGGTSTATADANNTFKVTDLPDPADTDPPSFKETNVSPTTLPAAGGTVTFTATVSDNRAIQSVTAEITRPGGTKTIVTLALQSATPGTIAVTGNYSGAFNAPANTGQTNQVYRVAFFAKDASNNTAGPVRGESFTVSGTVPDTDPPAISGNTVTPAEFEREGGTANFAVTVKDNVDVASALVRITRPDNTTQDVNLTRLQANSTIAGVTVRFTGSFAAPANATTQNRKFKATFVARDGAGNETRANGETIIVKGCGTPPNITGQSLTPNKLPSTGGKVSFNATVTSCDANPTVMVQVFGSGAKEVARAVLTRTSGNTFSGSARIPANRKKKNVGYAVVISASDSVGDDGPKPVGSITVAKKK